eukprot:TRINITY_DN11683_c0_g3_i1.p1 TRINITY_DN11683_c0_g3~~TRINITY_DN11683_c0_g3_i1.p1  ORF type:complete len:472 (+),score=83.47 TRINITY_DN11683_c0_g3_i1:155-1570(+)
MASPQQFAPVPRLAHLKGDSGSIFRVPPQNIQRMVSTPELHSEPTNVFEVSEGSGWMDCVDEEMILCDDEPGFQSMESIDTSGMDCHDFSNSSGMPSVSRHRNGARQHSLFQLPVGGVTDTVHPLKIDTSSLTPLMNASDQIKKRASPPLASPSSFRSSVTQNKKKRPAPLHLADALSTQTPASCTQASVFSIGAQTPSLSTVNLNELAFENITCEGETKWGVSLQKGRRRHMEDTFRAVPMVGNDARRGFYGVFDGHGGRKAADFAAEYLSHFASTNLDTLEDVGKMFQDAFLEADKKFCETAEREGLGDGTTAVIAYLKGGKMWVANVGDSRAVISRGGVAAAVTLDHKAESEQEQKRIESKGGTVFHLGQWRVEGVLAVTRAIGDKDLKKCVTAHPDVYEFDLTSEDEFVVMASDGLWDVMDNQEAVDIVLAHQQDLGLACDALVAAAMTRGSNDNISALVVNTREYL